MDFVLTFNQLKVVFFFLVIFGLMGCSKTESFSASKLEQVDQLLKKYQGNGPGYAFGIVRGGQLVYSNGYGYANLDYRIPITDSTAFYIGSMAKQFTAAALLLLESDGKLDFNKPVREYLPEFPDYQKEITINHLIHHTSGIRETNSLQLFQGIDRKFEEPFDTNDLVQLVQQQKELNFSPGREFRYSSGGYALLAKIVEKLSGQSLRDFLDHRVFKPLQMENTFVCDDHNEVVSNRAVSYWPVSDNEFERRSQVFDAYGDGGIITTIKDLAKWDKAFYQDVLHVPDFAAKMYQKTTLDKGDTINYARALNIWNHKGQRVVQHNGGMLGFRVDMVRFPDLATTFILLGNSAGLDPTGDALQIAEILLSESFKQTGIKKNKNSLSGKNSQIPFSQEIAGTYWTDEANYWRRISIQNDSLFIDSGNRKNGHYLSPVSPNEFIADSGKPSMHLSFEPQDHMVIRFGNGTKRTFRKFDPEPPLKLQEITYYSGIYESQELKSTYRIFMEKGKLLLTINDNKPKQLFPVPKQDEIVWNGKKMVWIGFAEMKFDFDKKGRVEGFTIGDARVSGVNFKKVE